MIKLLLAVAHSPAPLGMERGGELLALGFWTPTVDRCAPPRLMRREYEVAMVRTEHQPLHAGPKAPLLGLHDTTTRSSRRADHHPTTVTVDRD